MKKLFLLFLMLMFVFSFASAEQFFTGHAANISVPVRVNGATSSTVKCNITIFDPNNNILVPFQAMTNDVAYTKNFYYTLPASNTSQIGNYCGDITCFDSATGLNATETKCIDVNNAGKDYSTEEAITYILVLIVLIGLFLLCLWGAIKLPWENPRGEWGEVLHINYKKYGKIFCVGFSYIFLVWIVYIIWNLCYAFLQLQALNTFLMFLFYILLGLSLPLLVVGIVGTLIIYTREKKIMEALNRGLTIR